MAIVDKEAARSKSCRPARLLLEALATIWLMAQPGRRVAVETLRDLTRSREELLAENRALRQQVIILRRRVKRPRMSPWDRVALLVFASLTRTWQSMMIIVKPETVLRWHRQGWRLIWKRKSRPKGRPPLHADTVQLIQRMARENHLWGAERIRGELLKLGHRVAKRTVQKYMRRVRPRRPTGQTWATFLRNHAPNTWACDFIQTFDVLFRPVFAFVIIHLGTREVVHVGATYHPTSRWVTQQLREATADGRGPEFLIRDNDAKFGVAFDAFAKAAGIDVKRTPRRAPRANAFCERFIGSLRRECLDHVLLLGVGHLGRVLREYAAFFNTHRPHQGLGQRVPTRDGGDPDRRSAADVASIPVLGGLHHAYFAPG